jgi:hypothetical protein
MKLTRVFVHRSTLSGELSGKVTLEGPEGEITVTLNDEGARKVVAACADALVVTATASAAQLRDAVLLAVEAAKT